MPGITTSLPNMARSGPLIEAVVSPSTLLVQQLIANGSPIPPSVDVQLLIDTGAACSVLKPDVIKALGISPVGVGRVATPSTDSPVLMSRFQVDIGFTIPKVGVNNILVFEAPLGGQNIQGLVGRDILAHACLVYVGYANLYTLTF